LDSALSRLLLDLSGLSGDQIEDLGRRKYAELYLSQGKEYGVHRTHDGEIVFFWENRFDHAFFTTSDRRCHQDRKDIIDPERVARVGWIGPLLRGEIPGSACWTIDQQDPGQRNPKRLYLIDSERYVIWLKRRNAGGWAFSSAYTALYTELHNYTRYGRRLCRF